MRFVVLQLFRENVMYFDYLRQRQTAHDAFSGAQVFRIGIALNIHFARRLDAIKAHQEEPIGFPLLGGG